MDIVRDEYGITDDGSLLYRAAEKGSEISGLFGPIQKSDAEFVRAAAELGRGNFGEAWDHFVNSWKEAFKEPSTYVEGAVSLGVGASTARSVSARMISSESRLTAVEARAQALLDGQPGINFTSRVDTVRYRQNISGGQAGAGTALTDLKAFEDIICPIPSSGNRLTISKKQAVALEDALGLPTGRVSQGGVISIADDVASRAPRSPLSGNQLFLGGGRGLPGGGPEINVAPINTSGGGGIRQIILASSAESVGRG